MHFSGLSISQLAYLVAKLARMDNPRSLGLGSAEAKKLSQLTRSGKLLIVTPDSASADQLASDISFFFQSTEDTSKAPAVVLNFERWDMLPFEGLSPTALASANRIHTLATLLKDDAYIVIAPVDALMQRIIKPADFLKQITTLTTGQTLPREVLVDSLMRSGFLRHSLVEGYGEMAIRGAVVDVFPPGLPLPLRLEFEGDKVASIRRFDSQTQRSLDKLSAQSILPARELFSPQSMSELREAIQRLRHRASQLSLAQRELEPIVQAIETNSLWPGIEHLQPLISESLGLITDYLSPDSAIILWDKLRILAAADTFETICCERELRAEEEGHIFPTLTTAYLSSSEILKILEKQTTIHVDRVELLDDFSSEDDRQEGPKIKLQALSELHAAMERERFSARPLSPLSKLILAAKRKKQKVLFVCQNEVKAQKLRSLLQAYDFTSQSVSSSFWEWLDSTDRLNQLGESAALAITTGNLTSGFTAQLEEFVLISDHDLFATPHSIKRSVAKKSFRRAISRLSQLDAGNHVVHVDHGIAIFRGLQEISVEGTISDYLQLEFADEAKLYIPVEHLGQIHKYIGAAGKEPALSKLGNKSWDKTKKNVREKVAELAGQLVALYARRHVAEGIAYGESDEHDLEFASTFPFDETPDQERAIIEVLSDMAGEKPMDRLVCGDVGYGKTEVALRAAFKAVNNNRQVAVLVPTTILADQHFATFSERFSNYPVTVSCINRFMGPKQNKATLQLLSEGKVDILIGTHRILQRDVMFRNLGLVIIDEEHRFGVAQKERLKKLRCEVDVLTLTATPIPRTLHMSLLGIRDMSVIETPPCDRQVTRTYVARYDETIVKEAIVRELGRQGQIFYIHNKVSNIAQVTYEIRQLVPSARVEFAHGQMKETELETIMHRFVKREIDVLVCTTIVESGLDIPNANTIIIRDADRLGLAELYQLRGRVGRGARRAYAYLLVKDFRKINEEAQKRLQVLQDLDDLGVGFRLALQDMEIRGAGNLLGKDQSGAVNLVGFDLFSQILRDAILDLRNRGTIEQIDESSLAPVIDPEVNIGFPAHIPTSYIPDVAERLLLFQRLVELTDFSEGDELFEEICDRFGNPPDDVKTLVELMAFRGVLKKHWITAATLKNNILRLTFHPLVKLDPEQVLKAVRSSQGSLKVSASRVLSVHVWEDSTGNPRDIANLVGTVVEKITAGNSIAKVSLAD